MTQGVIFLPCCLLWSCHEFNVGVSMFFSFPLISGVMFLVPLQICLSFNCDIGGRAVGSRVVPSFPWAWLRPETRGVMSCWAASPREMPRWEPEPSAPGAARPPPALARRENGRKNSVPLPGRSWCSWILGGLTQGIEQCIRFKLLTLFSSFLFCHTIVFFFWGGLCITVYSVNYISILIDATGAILVFLYLDWQRQRCFMMLLVDAWPSAMSWLLEVLQVYRVNQNFGGDKW